jgi:hypothetical protein
MELTTLGDNGTGQFRVRLFFSSSAILLVHLCEEIICSFVTCTLQNGSFFMELYIFRIIPESS